MEKLYVEVEEAEGRQQSGLITEGPIGARGQKGSNFQKRSFSLLTDLSTFYNLVRSAAQANRLQFVAADFAINERFDS